MRVNQSRAWHTGNGSPDAICFTVDRPGVMLVGVGAYGGLGHYEYTLELLQDLRVIEVIDTYIPLILYPRKGSRGILDILPRRPCFIKVF
jgi:hypothetical protein